MSLRHFTFAPPGEASGGATAVRWAAADDDDATLAALQINCLGAPSWGGARANQPPFIPNARRPKREGDVPGLGNYDGRTLRQWRHMGGGWTLPEQMETARHSRLTARVFSASHSC